MQIVDQFKPGLTKDIEFVAVAPGIVKAYHDEKILKFNELPPFAYNTIRLTMGNPNASIDEMQLFVFGRWGRLDGKPDIYECGKAGDPEYMPGHSNAFYDCGREISDGHMRVIQHLHLSTSQEIADKIFIAKRTVERHLQDIFEITGFKNRTQLALWANEKGYLQTVA